MHVCLEGKAQPSHMCNILLSSTQKKTPFLAGDTGIGKSTFERAVRKHVLFRSIDAEGVTVINGADYSDPTRAVS